MCGGPSKTTECSMIEVFFIILILFLSVINGYLAYETYMFYKFSKNRFFAHLSGIKILSVIVNIIVIIDFLI